jgi:cell wall-associated NlpC family hydrolase
MRRRLTHVLVAVAVCLAVLVSFSAQQAEAKRPSGASPHAKASAKAGAKAKRKARAKARARIKAKAHPRAKAKAHARARAHARAKARAHVRAKARVRARLQRKRRTGVRAVKIAHRFLGVRYAYGGASPHGFDCSGLVQYVYGRLGVRLPHYTYSQFRLGRRVSRRGLRPGDLVFMNGVQHVGIYAGGNRFIHAPSSGDVVKVSRLTGWYTSAYVGARRIVRPR